MRMIRNNTKILGSFLSGKILVSYLALLGFFVFGLVTQAVSENDVVFPIPELNDCVDKDECNAYCDELANKDVCLAFAKKHNLISEEELEKAERLPGTGPGGCTSETECRDFCSQPENAEECLNFAQKHRLIDNQEIKAVREIIKEGGPGGCPGG